MYSKTRPLFLVSENVKNRDFSHFLLYKMSNFVSNVMNNMKITITSKRSEGKVKIEKIGTQLDIHDF